MNYYTVNNIVWENTNADASHLPTTARIDQDEIDVHGLPRIDSPAYEAELEWMLMEALIEKYDAFPMEFVLADCCLTAN